MEKYVLEQEEKWTEGYLIAVVPTQLLPGFDVGRAEEGKPGKSRESLNYFE